MPIIMLKRSLYLLLTPLAVVALLLNVACMISGLSAGIFPQPLVHVFFIFGGILLLRWWPIYSSIPIIAIGWMLPGSMYAENVVFVCYWLAFGLMLIVLLGSTLGVLIYFFRKRASFTTPAGRLIATFGAPSLGILLLAGVLFIAVS